VTDINLLSLTIWRGFLGQAFCTSQAGHVGPGRKAHSVREGFAGVPRVYGRDVGVKAFTWTQSEINTATWILDTAAAAVTRAASVCIALCSSRSLMGGRILIQFLSLSASTFQQPCTHWHAINPIL
jgi:hypothetical protein